jgi:branched-chain amino acid transport system substrate-binding protein
MNKNTKTVIAVMIIIVVIGLIWFGVNKSKNPIIKEPIKIGVILPLSGNSAEWGTKSKKGIDLAIEEINGTNGINGIKLEVIYEDTSSEATKAVSALKKLINVNNIKVVIGSVNSPETLAMAPIAEEHKIILIAPGSATPKLTTAGDYIFRTRVSSDIESIELSKTIFNQLGIREIAFLARNDDYGQGIIDPVTKSFKSLGGKIVLAEKFSPGESNYRIILTKIKSKSPEALIIAAKPTEVGLIIKNMKELNLKTKILIHSGSKGPEIYDIAKEAADGLMALSTFNAERPETDAYIKNYSQKYNEEVEFVSALAYDAVRIIAEMIKKCGLKTDCVKNNLYLTKNYHGASSDLTFDANGDVMQPFTLEILRDGKFELYQK